MKKLLYLTNQLLSSLCRGARDGNWSFSQCVNCKHLSDCIRQTNK
jgi:hypothetical protein